MNSSHSSSEAQDQNGHKTKSSLPLNESSSLPRDINDVTETEISSKCVTSATKNPQKECISRPLLLDVSKEGRQPTKQGRQSNTLEIEAEESNMGDNCVETESSMPVGDAEEKLLVNCR